ncbi:MAG: primosomal protein N' [Bacteroidaceae bacterium]|nr:primosomal protein N' [Bacteroidaceae bacterium]
MPLLADILLPLALPKPLTYSVPEAMERTIRKGSRVVVPVGKSKQYTGIVVELQPADTVVTDFELRDILELDATSPLITAQQIDFWNWMARYYMCTPGEVMKAALPALLKKTSDVEKAETRRQQALYLKPVSAELGAMQPLSSAQCVAFQQIKDAWAGTDGVQQHDVCLLQGVTSSGKTEVYIHLIQEAIARGEQVLYMLPEIALTTQITTRLGRVFGEQMGVYHSRFTDARRASVYFKQASESPYPLILGVRSALFLPFQRLGLIIVDEEHETSYKQQDPAPRYHARDAAIVLARRTGAKVLLGTATPSVETYYHTETGKYALVKLTTRFGGVNLPEVIVEDVATLRRKKLMKTSLSPRLTEEMRSALAQGKQIILFQNRRGYAPVLTCRTCGWTPRCEACDVSLTYHARAHRLVCHYCGRSYDVPASCPQCNDSELRDIGYGTEKIEEEVKKRFPEARVTRMDLDSTRAVSAYEKIIDSLSNGEIDILIGTQMVTKGLDFERVSLVGILNADQGLAMPDFRAAERTYQLLSQVAGRAGRRGQRGRVVLQTSHPDLPLIHQVVSGNYDAFYQQQMEERRMLSYPPFVRLISIYFKHRDDKVVEATAQRFRELLSPFFGDSLLGPYRPVVARVQRQFIRQMTLKVSNSYSSSSVRSTLSAARDRLLNELNGNGRVTIFFDADPL